MRKFFLALPASNSAFVPNSHQYNLNQRARSLSCSLLNAHKFSLRTECNFYAKPLILKLRV